MCTIYHNVAQQNMFTWIHYYHGSYGHRAVSRGYSTPWAITGLDKNPLGWIYGLRRGVYRTWTTPHLGLFNMIRDEDWVPS